MENDFFFPPYVGNLYGKPNNFFNGKKILVIGNSHYCDDGYDIPKSNDKQYGTGCWCSCKNYMKDKCHNKNGDKQFTWTEDAISETRDVDNFAEAYKKYLTSYLKFAIIMDESFRGQNNLNKNERYLTFWGSIVFYNFLQSAVPSNNSQGTPKEIEKSKEIFKSLFPYLEAKYSLPDVIIVWGKENVFNHFLEFPNFELLESRLGKFRYAGKEIDVICIYHPSARKSYEEQRNIIKGYIPELFPY